MQIITERPGQVSSEDVASPHSKNTDPIGQPDLLSERVHILDRSDSNRKWVISGHLHIRPIH